MRAIVRPAWRTHIGGSPFDRQGIPLEAGEIDDLIATQRDYYELRADDYMRLDAPSDRKGRGFMRDPLTRALIEGLQPTGDVLEIACGTGESTRFLAPLAASLTALDGSVRMIELNRERVADPRVEYVHADVFTWRPSRTYDLVFFSAWLSHVPPRSFDVFWSLLRDCLGTGGRVAFLDEDDRAASYDDQTTVNGVPTATRTLRDGRSFQIVKVFWPPAELEHRLRELGWDATVCPVGDTFMLGVAAPR